MMSGTFLSSIKPTSRPWVSCLLPLFALWVRPVYGATIVDGSRLRGRRGSARANVFCL